MSYFGSKLSQADVAAVLRPYRDDKNVSPDEMAAYARARGLQAIVRVNGDADRLKRLLSAGVPVLLETWYEPKPNDGMGHYRLWSVTMTLRESGSPTTRMTVGAWTRASPTRESGCRMTK
jgi:hypothetical protein